MRPGAGGASAAGAPCWRATAAADQTAVSTSEAAAARRSRAAGQPRSHAAVPGRRHDGDRPQRHDQQGQQQPAGELDGLAEQPQAHGEPEPCHDGHDAGSSGVNAAGGRSRMMIRAC